VIHTPDRLGRHIQSRGAANCRTGERKAGFVQFHGCLAGLILDCLESPEKATNPAGKPHKTSGQHRRTDRFPDFSTPQCQISRNNSVNDFPNPLRSPLQLTGNDDLHGNELSGDYKESQKCRPKERGIGRKNQGKENQKEKETDK